MSITAKFYTFSKRENSTKQPTGGAQYNILLKDDCSITNPVITLSGANPRQYNYAYIQDFGRYYFVNDWVCNHNGLWTAHLSVDVLATYKTDIGASTEYVLRSASQFDGDIIDSLYPTKPAITETRTSTVRPFTVGTSQNPGTMSFVIGVINDISYPKVGALTYYVLTPGQFGGLMQFMFGNAAYAVWIDPSTGQLVDDSYAKATFNPIQYITECFAIPYTPPNTVSAELHFGWYIPLIGGQTIAPPAIEPYSLTFDLQSNPYVFTRYNHPDAATRGNYLNGAPFTQLYFKAGPFGEIVIDSNLIQNDTGIQMEMKGDFMGQMIMDIYTYTNGQSNRQFISRERANVKMPFPIAQVNNNPIQFYSSIMSMLPSSVGLIGSIASGNVVGALGSAVQIESGVMSATKAMAGQVQKSGAQSAIIEAFQEFYLVTKTSLVCDDDNVHRGRPLCKPVQISTLSGYILVSDADLEISGTYEENQKVKGYMNSGFYYE